MNKDTNKTELGVIRTLANAEEYARKAEKELSSNIGMPLNNEKYDRVFNISGINIVKAKEDIQEIKKRKIKELINKYESITGIILLPQKVETEIFTEIENKSKAINNWFEVIRTSQEPCQGTCQIIDKYTKVILLETTIPIADKIIKATFGRTQEEKQKADKLWEEIENKMKYSLRKITRVDIDYGIVNFTECPELLIPFETTLEECLTYIH